MQVQTTTFKSACCQVDGRRFNKSLAALFSRWMDCERHSAPWVHLLSKNTQGLFFQQVSKLNGIKEGSYLYSALASLTDRTFSCIQNCDSVNICILYFWIGKRGRNRKVKQHLFSLARSPLGRDVCKSETEVLTSRACHQTSAFKSRFNAWEKRFILPTLLWVNTESYGSFIGLPW